MTNSINQEIINTLEEKKFISEHQLEKIKDKLKDICGNEFKEFHKHFQDYYKKMSYKKFLNEMINYLIKDNERESFKICDDYVLNQIETENQVNSFFDELVHKDTETLKNYDIDNSEFTHIEYYDNWLIEEDIKNCLDVDNDEYKNLQFENSGSITYLEIKGFNILEDFEHYENFKDFFEDLENFVYDVDFKTQIYHRFLLENDYFNTYLNYDNKTLIKLDKDIKAEISKILDKRLILYNKDLKKIRNKKYKLNSELKQINKPMINESINIHIEKINKHIEFIKSEIKLIGIKK